MVVEKSNIIIPERCIERAGVYIQDRQDMGGMWKGRDVGDK